MITTKTGRVYYGKQDERFDFSSSIDRNDYITAKDNILKKLPIDNVIYSAIGYSFDDRQTYSLILLKTKSLLNNLKAERLKIHGETPQRIYSIWGLDVLLTNKHVYLKGHCDENYCGKSPDGDEIDWYIEDFEPMNIPFSSDEIVDIKLNTDGMLFLLSDKSVYALGANPGGKFCSTGTEKYANPSLILQDVDDADFGMYFMSYRKGNDVYICGQIDEFRSEFQDHRKYDKFAPKSHNPHEIFQRETETEHNHHPEPPKENSSRDNNSQQEQTTKKRIDTHHVSVTMSASAYGQPQQRLLARFYDDIIDISCTNKGILVLINNSNRTELMAIGISDREGILGISQRSDIFEKIDKDFIGAKHILTANGGTVIWGEEIVNPPAQSNDQNRHHHGPDMGMLDHMPHDPHFHDRMRDEHNGDPSEHNDPSQENQGNKLL